MSVLNGRQLFEKSVNMCCWCNVLSYNTFYGTVGNMHVCECVIACVCWPPENCQLIEDNFWTKDNLGWRNTHSDLKLTRDTQTEVTDLGLPIVRLHNTYSHSFQQPFKHTINKQADKHNMQWLEMGMWGQWGWDETEVFSIEWEAAVWKEWEHVLLEQCFII